PEPASAGPARPALAPPPAAPAYASGDGANGGVTAIAESGELRNLSPAVRKLMRENNVAADELARVAGSGIAGRVTRDDLLEYLQNRAAAPAARPSGAPAMAPAREAAP